MAKKGHQRLHFLHSLEKAQLPQQLLRRPCRALVKQPSGSLAPSFHYWKNSTISAAAAKMRTTSRTQLTLDTISLPLCHPEGPAEPCTLQSCSHCTTKLTVVTPTPPPTNPPSSITFAQYKYFCASHPCVYILPAYQHLLILLCSQFYLVYCNT